MQAVLLKDKGDVDQLVVKDIAKPEIQADEVRVKTEAFSINPIEVKTRKGNRFTEELLNHPPSILGWDGAGIVEEVGVQTKDFKVGDRVFGVIGFPDFGRTYADYFVAKEKDIVTIPEDVAFADAAVSTIAALTAYQALTYEAKLKKGARVLIHAASGGVGHFGVQLAREYGAEVYATASERNRGFVLDLGADHFIDYKTQKFEEVVPKVDVVFDLIGGDYIDRSLQCLKTGGTIISIPSATNAAVEQKAAAQKASGVRFIMKANSQDLVAVANRLNDGRLQPHISKIFTLKEIRAAHQAMEEGHTRGKIVVKP